MRRRGQTQLQRFNQRRIKDEIANSNVSCSLPNSSNVVKLTLTETADSNLVVIFEDGNANVVGSQEMTIQSTARLIVSGSPAKVLAAQCLPISEARLSLLKPRLDLAASMPQDSLAIGAVYEKFGSGNLYYGVWLLPTQASQTNEITTTEPVFSHDLTSLLQHAGKINNIGFSAAGQISLNHGSTSTILEITTNIPQKLPVRKHAIPNAGSTLELASDITMYASTDKVCIGNTNLDSILASSTLSDSGRKRKRDGEPSSRMTFVAYFSQMKRVLAYSEGQLLAIDLLTKHTAVNPLKEGALLSSNILRGSSSKSTEQRRYLEERKTSIGKVRQEPAVHNWQIVSKELDVLAERADVGGFRDVFTKTFELSGPDDPKSGKVPARQLDYLLTKLFQITNTQEATYQLKVAFRHDELLKWCMNAGLLEEQRLGQALEITASQMTPGSIARAIIEADGSLALIESYVQLSPHLLPASLIQIIKIMVSKALQHSIQSMDLEEAAEIEARDEGIPAHALMLGADPDTELNTSTPATICLAHALKRLSHTGAATVSTQLRTLDQKTVLGLVQFLRQQLFLGGYSRLDGVQHMPSPPASEGELTEKDNPNPQLPFNAIVTLLNGCIDAIGPVGVLGAGEDEQFVQKMVPELLSEISGAAQAIEDSGYLQGLVRETLRYVESMERQPFEVRNQVEHKKDPKTVQKGQIVTLYAEPDIGDSGAVSVSALPLSLKADEDVSRYKSRKGGQEHRRSAREIGMLKDRLRTPYSFERLIL